MSRAERSKARAAHYRKARARREYIRNGGAFGALCRFFFFVP